MSGISSKACIRRSFTAAYCSDSLSVRPRPTAQAESASGCRKILTAKIVFRSDVTSKMNSVEGASGSLSRGSADETAVVVEIRLHHVHDFVFDHPLEEPQAGILLAEG